MSAIVYSSANIGFDGKKITIECDLSKSLPGIVIVGLGAKAIDESRERVRSAIRNSGLTVPNKKITLNLAPADIPKDGTSYDLPLAVAILVSSEQIEQHQAKDSSFIGELALDGSIRPVRGIISHVEIAKTSGLKRIFVPEENYPQASLITGIEIIPCSKLLDVVNFLNLQTPAPANKQRYKLKATSNKTLIDYADIKGQEQAKRALEIAATGHHNVLLNGSPGAGKTMMAKALLSILPEPSEEEIIEITKIHSLSGETSLTLTERPFRSPHHTSSSVALIGGGKIPKPGEISLSHRGVLFLDEIPEFSRPSLEALRQPLEDKMINISRANQNSSYPANFMLIATQNPCPCGYSLDEDIDCTCSSLQISNYNKKLSGPLLDRIDMAVTVQKVNHRLLLSTESPDSIEDSQTIKLRVARGREMQSQRFKSKSKTNSEMTNKDIKQLANLSNEAKQFLDSAATKLKISSRGYMRTIRVGRTIADLEGSTDIHTKHIAEALQYRQRN